MEGKGRKRRGRDVVSRRREERGKWRENVCFNGFGRIDAPIRSTCCNNVFHLGKLTGIVMTTAHYLKHPAGWKTVRNLVC